MSKRKNQSPELNAKMALEALKGSRSSLCWRDCSAFTRYDPQVVGASGVFERGSRKAPKDRDAAIVFQNKAFYPHLPLKRANIYFRLSCELILTLVHPLQIPQNQLAFLSFKKTGATDQPVA